jgi:hypothetical protein
MAILDLLKKGSVLTEYDGKTPSSYEGNSNYVRGLQESQLDLNGKKPLEYDKQTKQIIVEDYSILDLNGKTPSKYLDNLPR